MKQKATLMKQKATLMKQKATLIRINTEYTNLTQLLEQLRVYLGELQPRIRPINDWEDVCVQYISEDTENNPAQRMVKLQKFYTRDKSTQDLYCADDSETLRTKLLLLSLGTCTINLIALIAYSVYRLLKLISLYECRKHDNPRLNNLVNWSLDLAILILGPLILLAMQITAMLGAITPIQHGPRDARKMYALGETMLFGYNGWRIAPCFRPNPNKHLFGGKIGKLNQW